MARYLCDYCQQHLSGFLVRCMECEEFDLCLQCFSCGVESGSHKKEHKYRVGHVTGFAAFEVNQSWSLAEEHMLLDAVEQYGYGNWKDVACHVETRTEDECEDHFAQFYIRGTIGRATAPSESRSKVTDHSGPEGGPLSPSCTYPIPPVDLSLQEQHELGYMPLRNDFEWEYDNIAESLISGLAVNPDDCELDLDVKLSCVSKYRLRLRERDRRKRIARSHNLITTSLIPNKNGKMSAAKHKFVKEDSDFMERMKVFTQFQTSAELECLHEGLLKEKEEKAKHEDLSEMDKRGRLVLNVTKLKKSMSAPEQNSMVSKKAEGDLEKLDILIKNDIDVNSDEEGMLEDNKEMACIPYYGILSRRESKLCDSIWLVPCTYCTRSRTAFSKIMYSTGKF